MNLVVIVLGVVFVFLGVNFMLLFCWLFGSGDEGVFVIVFLVVIFVLIVLFWLLWFGLWVFGLDDIECVIYGFVVYVVVIGWLYGVCIVV